MIAALRRWLDPFIVALVATMLLAVFFPVSGTAATAFERITDIAISVLFLVYGMRIKTQDAIAGLRHWKLQSAVLAATYVMFPVYGLVLRPLAEHLMGPSLATGLMFLCLLPSTVQSSVAFTSIARGNVAAAICAASLSNVLGMFITPALVAVFLHQYGGVSANALTSILLQMLVPFIVGQLLQPKVGDWVRGHRWLTVISDRGTILLVVYSAFSAGMAANIWSGLSFGSIVVLIIVCVVLLTAALCTTWFAGRRLAREDRIVLLMCGSKKSLATGVPMAAVLFPPAVAAAVTLPVMVFHQIQLITCAVIARRLAPPPQRLTTAPPAPFAPEQ